MSLLTMCQSVLAETGWPMLATIAGNSDSTARQIFAIANTELRALSELFNWPHTEVEYVFNTTPLQAVNLLPADFRVLAPQSLFNRDAYYGLKGSEGLQYWELLKYGKLSQLTQQHFRLVYPLGAPGVELNPVPSAMTGLVLVYYSQNYARTVGGEGIRAYASDADISKIPERYVELGVKWRFRRAKGLDFSAELAEYTATVQTQFAKYISSAEITIGHRRPNANDGITQGYVRDGGFGV